MDPLNKTGADLELPAGTAISRYVVGRKLGAGQMGEVYQATSPEGTEVAIKLLRTAAIANNADVERRFRREAMLCRSLKHRNVVSVVDHGLHHGAPFFVMPLLRGTDLDDCLTKTGALEPEVAVGIVLQACAGVRAAHEAGVVHRDLKPANIFLDERSVDQVVVTVCDFGVAKLFDDDGTITASGAVLGTPLYMAPEQLLSAKHVDVRCDVWALGMVLYHALCGRPAFHEAKTLGDLVLLLNEGRVPPLQERAPWVTPALARVVHASLLPLDRRISSVVDLEDALLRWAPAEALLTRAHLAPLRADRRDHVATRASLPMAAAELVQQADATHVGEAADAAVPEGPDPHLGRTLADRYRVVAKIGSGGMGAVYEAIDTTAAPSAQRVAIKVMQQEGGSRGVEAARRFLREAKASARIASPHVTRFLDSGVDAATGCPFIVMERLAGRDLSSHLAVSGALDTAAVVALFLQACGALTAAHALGIVHRDIKPSNLFLHEEGDTIVLKVCDFGIAKQLSREGATEASTELTRSGGLIGSPLYMSPEQAKSSKNVDERTDIFSLALTLHEALSGERPWRGRTSMGEIIVAVCTEDVQPLTACAPWVDPALGAVLAKALSRDPAARFPTMQAFAAALAPFAVARSLSQVDLVGVPSEVRARAPRPPPAAAAVWAADTEIHGKTADAISVTASEPAVKSRRPTGALIAVGLALVAGLGAVTITRLSSKTDSGSDPSLAGPRDLAPSLPASAGTLATSTDAGPSPSDSAVTAAGSSSAPSESASAAAAAQAGAVRGPRAALDAGHATRPGTTTGAGATGMIGATAPANPATPTTGAASVGRGFTATDLPPTP